MSVLTKAMDLDAAAGRAASLFVETFAFRGRISDVFFESWGQAHAEALDYNATWVDLRPAYRERQQHDAK